MITRYPVLDLLCLWRLVLNPPKIALIAHLLSKYFYPVNRSTKRWTPIISNIKISQHSSPKDLDAELSSQIWKLNGMRFALSKSIDPGRVIVGNPIENFHYEQAVHEALEK